MVGWPFDCYSAYTIVFLTLHATNQTIDHLNAGKVLGLIDLSRCCRRRFESIMDSARADRRIE